MKTINIRGSQSFIKVEASIFALLPFSFYHVVCLGKFIYLFIYLFGMQVFQALELLIRLCLPYLESTLGKLLF